MKKPIQLLTLTLAVSLLSGCLSFSRVSDKGGRTNFGIGPTISIDVKAKPYSPEGQ